MGECTITLTLLPSHPSSLLPSLFSFRTSTAARSAASHSPSSPSPCGNWCRRSSAVSVQASSKLPAVGTT